MAHSQVLSDTDREALLERLTKLQEEAASRVDARFRTAIAAYRSAMSSDEQTFQLYLNCVEKVDFEDEKRKAADFREWRRKEAERLSDAGLRRALRHQLRWLILTLQAASEDPDRAALANSAREIVNAIFDDAEKMAGQQQILGQSVTGSVFARAYEISHVQVENWPMSPTQLSQVYDQVLLPSLRATRQTASLRNAWMKRIEQEGAMREHWPRENRERGRVGMAANMRSPEYEKFIADEVPQLMWEMETDLFKHGDQSGAATRMLAHLEKYIGHRSAKGWADQFRELLAAATATAPAAPAAGGTVP